MLLAACGGGEPQPMGENFIAFQSTFEGAVELSLVVYRHDFDRTWHRLDHFRAGPNLYDLLSRDVRGTSEQRYLGVLRGDVDSAGTGESLMLLDNRRSYVAQGAQATARTHFDTGPVKHELEAGCGSTRAARTSPTRAASPRGGRTARGRSLRSTSCSG